MNIHLHKIQKWWLVVIGIVIGSFLLRFSTISSHPFWVDEFSTARNANLILRKGWHVFIQDKELLEGHNITTHFLVATSFLIFNQTTFAARLPFMIIGSLLPGVIFLFAGTFFSRKEAVAASLLAVFSYFQVTWSLQARGYVVQQLLILLSLLTYTQLKKKKTLRLSMCLLFLVLLGIATHSTYLLILVAMVLDYLLTNHTQLFQLIKKAGMKLIVITLSLLGLFLLVLWYQLEGLIDYFQLLLSHGFYNNLWYYHSFLWRQQTIVSLLMILGVISLFLKKRNLIKSLPILLSIGTYLFFVCFLFGPYVSRYLLPVFPLFLVLAAHGVVSFAKGLSKTNSWLVVLVIVFFIIGNGDTFVLKPKRFYSVNHDMREVALLDYDQVYQIILDKGDFEAGTTVVIDTWPDRARWYLGYNNPYIYFFHWQDEELTINGLDKKTKVVLNEQGEKVLPEFQDPPILFVGELADLRNVMSKYAKGFIWIDDTTLPADVIEYAETNFKKELYLDHYYLDDNPYSIWPGTLYSWGI